MARSASLPSGEAGLDDYFEAIQSALREAGIVQPALIVDRDRLDANLAKARSLVPEDLAVRIVAKSLPSIPLLERCLERAPTDRLMTFNLPMLISLAKTFPDAGQLLGKPFPVDAAAAFLREQIAPETASRVGWLIDTSARLRQYDDLAASRDRTFGVVLEIDVGLHRGGFVPGPELTQALQEITDSRHLEFCGFMGYEPHVAKIPVFGGWRRRVHDRAMRIFEEANKSASAIVGAAAVEASLRNTGGSLTFMRYRDTRIANDLSFGSALVKPTDFDHPDLSALQPALFIAAPVLKTVDSVLVPGLEGVSRLRNALSGGGKKAVYIHGGNWKAHPVMPSGAGFHPTFGRSSNQEMVTLPRSSSLQVDDFLFFRPTQSEAVMQQFGDIAVYAEGRIVDMWPAMPMAA